MRENKKMKFFDAIEKDKKLSELKIRLEKVPDSYHDFVIGTLIYCYKDKATLKKVKKYLADNPDADSSDIIFIVE